MKVSLWIAFSCYFFSLNVMALKAIQLLFHWDSSVRTNFVHPPASPNSCASFVFPSHFCYLCGEFSKAKHFPLSSSDCQLCIHPPLPEDSDETPLHWLHITFRLGFLCIPLPPCPIGSVWLSEMISMIHVSLCLKTFRDNNLGWLAWTQALISVSRKTPFFLFLSRRKQSKGERRFTFCISSLWHWRC